MSTDQLQRPQFYEGQYLGAADLAAVIDYARLRAARHSLGAHTWGIAVGLELKEEPSLAGGGAVDIYIQPGYVVDGFGRALVVTTPYQIPAALFKDENTGRVKVWLRYVEQPTAEPGFGFAVCETEDQHARVAETFEIVVGGKARLEKRDEISVAGQSIDVIEALYAFDENDPLLCDGSVPFQTFPDPGEALWLVPLGCVRWDSAAGQLVETTADDRLASRAFRRHLGVVAEDVYAADGLIRLRRRGVDTDGAALFADCEADEQTFDTASGLDLAYDEDKQRARPLELVWIEGDLRLAGDGRLFGGKLEFRDADGDDGVPLWIQRGEANDRGGKDLQLLLGAGNDGENRLVVGQLTVDADGNASVTDRVIVQDDGKVGIGITDQAAPFQVPLTIRGLGDQEDLVDFQTSDGNPAWRINQKTEADTEGLNVAALDAAGTPTTSRLFLQNNGSAGLGTAEPEHTLQIGDAGGRVSLGLRGPDHDTSSSVLAFEDDGGTAQRWFKVVYDTQDNRLNFESAEVSPILSLARQSGRLGVGTPSPQERLDVRGNIKLGTGGAFFAMGALENLRVVVGHVDAGGNKITGTGYSVEKPTIGEPPIPLAGGYIVTFDEPFDAPPVVLASAADADDNIAIVGIIDETKFRVLTRDTIGTDPPLQDTAFTFIALGVRS